MKLGDIATVRSGLVLSRKQAQDTSGINYPLLKLSSINSEGYINMGKLGVFNSEKKLPVEYLSRTGDVIIRLSIPYTAVLIDEYTSGIVVSSNFVIIRVDSDKVISEYIYWMLNTPEVKRDIYKSTGGNMLGSINAKYFSEFKFDLFSIHQQKKIADMNEMSKKELKLLTQLAVEKEKYYAMIIRNVYKKMKGANERDKSK